MTEPDRSAQPDPRSPDGLRPAPESLRGILRHLGPGLIIAGSIVGSGELIATTTTGAKAGFSLLWLILIGCVIKVFVQVELGRYTIVSGKTALAALDEVPGPRIRRRGNWLIWYWIVMWLAGIAQLGGIVGGVGQALAISLPVTDAGRAYNRAVAERIELAVERRETASTAGAAQSQSARIELDRIELDRIELDRIELDRIELDRIELARIDTAMDGCQERIAVLAPDVRDSLYWAVPITLVTAVLLVVGRYGLIQTISTAMVATFTMVTVANVFALQANGTWAVSPREILDGLSFRLPPKSDLPGFSPIATALATFGIIGVGAHELVAYPYWCLEKGYARFTGPRDSTSAWAGRAAGWLRVMRCDAWCSMAVYTFATVAFYLLGAAILGRIGLVPESNELISTLAVMYDPVFGQWGPAVFLFGAFAVLYSTFFVANAGFTRVCADALRVMNVAAKTEPGRQVWIRIFAGVLPLLCLGVYYVCPNPLQLVLVGGMMQAAMLPMLAFAALFFRYRRCDERIAPSRRWDLFLWLSSIGLYSAGCWLVYDVSNRLFAALLATHY